MKKIFLSSIIVASSLSIFSCKSSEVNPDNGSAIAGTYAIKSYITQSGSSGTFNNSNMRITRIDNNTVKIVVDYSDPTITDLTCDKVVITKSDSKYSLKQDFSNATMTGDVTGSMLTYKLDYFDNDYLYISASK